MKTPIVYVDICLVPLFGGRSPGSGLSEKAKVIDSAVHFYLQNQLSLGVLALESSKPGSIQFHHLLG